MTRQVESLGQVHRQALGRSFDGSEEPRLLGDLPEPEERNQEGSLASANRPGAPYPGRKQHRRMALRKIHLSGVVAPSERFVIATSFTRTDYRTMFPRCLFPFLIVVAIASVHASPPVVVETEPLSAIEQQKRFHLPSGFEIQLVLSEPLIGQPMNLNFDAAGRLWVTSSVEYPYPADGEGVQPRDPRWGQSAKHAPRDRVTVLEGIDSNGQPRKVWQYIQGLNIPIGITPTPQGPVVYSIPDVARYEDSDQDGTADHVVRLIEGFGNVDTHGMVNGLTQWLDGWIYACHGFRNQSHLRGRGGDRLTMQSGNTFRFRQDGSRVEQFTWGQVNPFGLTFDPWGNLYSADCHSKPLTCLLRGAYYSSFGKPHDGLGFGPDMIDHLHGSTGICGPAWYAARQFPPEYQGHLFLCNPVTGRVHRDRILWRGSSPWVDTQPDFLTCDDGWFRPVDIQLGPDGALYIADFYNAIIGHYEVPLEHPRRDRQHGRIWRVVYRGADSEKRREAPGPPDLTRLTVDELVQRLGDPNLTIRRLTVNRLALHPEPDHVLTAVRSVIDHKPAPDARVDALWVLERLKQLDDRTLLAALSDQSDVVRVHALRICAERKQLSGKLWVRTQDVLSDKSAMVRRVAADVLGRHPQERSFSKLWDTLIATLADNEQSRDTHLVHTLRMALRNHLRIESIAKSQPVLAALSQSPKTLSKVALGTSTPSGAALLLLRLQKNDPPLSPSERRRFCHYIARYGDSSDLQRLVELVMSTPSPHPGRQAEELRAIYRGHQERGNQPFPSLLRAAETVADQLLRREDGSALDWTAVSLVGMATLPETFLIEQRPSAQIEGTAPFFSSLPNGEQQTGLLRSDVFVLPETLTFDMAGHNGPPSQPDSRKNRVLLRSAATGQVLREAYPPRKDLAQPYRWDFKDLAGQTAYLEIIDADAGQAYAWLAVGRFSLSELNPGASPALAALELIEELSLKTFRPRLERWVVSAQTRRSVQKKAAFVLLHFQPDSRIEVLLAVMDRPDCQLGMENQVEAWFIKRSDDVVMDWLSKVFRSVPGPVQKQLALALAADAQGTAALLQLLEKGLASPQLLQDPTLVEQLQAGEQKDIAERLKPLLAGLTDRDEELGRLIARHVERYALHESHKEPNVSLGAAIFKKQCAICHQLDGEGEKIGPQLDGVGIRGPARLLEDILDPHRNVDAAFRSKILVLDSGRTLSGLIRRHEGNVLILADQQGKEIRVPIDQITLQKDSTLSLMPTNVADKLTPEELYGLIDYLRTKANRQTDRHQTP